MIRELHADEHSLFDGKGLFPRRWCMLCKHCAKLVNLRATTFISVSSQHDPVLHAIWSIVTFLGVDWLVSCSLQETFDHQQSCTWSNFQVCSLLCLTP